MSTVVRYDGELAKVAEKVRSDRSISQTIYPFITTSDRTIVCLDRYEWLQTAVNLFKSDEFRLNPNYVRFLVWRNKQADILNAYIRNSLWGEDVSAYVPGDRLIAKLPVFRSGSEYTFSKMLIATTYKLNQRNSNSFCLFEQSSQKLYQNYKLIPLQSHTFGNL